MVGLIDSLPWQSRPVPVPKLLNSKPTSDLSQTSSPILDKDSTDLLSKIQNTLEVKASEGIPLLEAFLSRLHFLWTDSMEKTKTVVVYGVPNKLPPSA